MATISAVLLCHNEAAVLPRCLRSLAWTDEIVVVDDDSTDESVVVAEQHGARVFHRRLDRYDTQRNYAAQQSTSEWVLSIDPDEEVPPELAAEIREVISRPDALDVYGIPFRHHMLGRWIGHGGWPAPLTRLYRRDQQWSGAVHEQVVKGARYGVLRAAMRHYSHRNVSEFLAKLDRYTDREAAARAAAGARHSNLKMVLSPLRDFLRRYLREGGWRDGTAGLVLAILMAFYVFSVRAKTWQLLDPGEEH